MEQFAHPKEESMRRYRSISAKKTAATILFFSLAACAFSQTELSPAEVNPFDRLIMNPYSETLDHLGTCFEAAALLTPAALLSAPSQDYWKIGIEYAETLAFTYGAKELAKLCVSRPRPYMYYDNAPQNRIDEGDWDDSFFSGHTTLSFAAAGFTTYMLCQYFPDSPWKIPVISASYLLAATTAGLRLASGNHFMTDVLCGAAAGTAIGFLVPYVNSLWWKSSQTFPQTDKVKLSVSPLGFSVSCRF